jgi:Protein of unknown function (DUF2812).
VKKIKKVIHKWFFVWDFDKEEKWLNEMSAIGLHLTDVGVCRYVFEEGTPGEYECRLELLDNVPSHPKSTAYIRFLEDTGAEYIGNVTRWAYFRRKTGDGAFDLFSDLDSRIRHLNRIIAMLIPVFILNIINAFSNFARYPSHPASSVFSIACLCFFLSLILGYGIFKIYLKKNRLQKERALHE